MIRAFGAFAADKPLEAMDIFRREPGANDVQIKIAYCGVCHSDLHTVRAEWGGTQYPCVPGHEIVGQVTAVGPSESKFKVGDTVGVGCMVDSCRHCEACDDGLSNIARTDLPALIMARRRTSPAIRWVAMPKPLLCATGLC